jgi:thymidylate kinase
VKSIEPSENPVRARSVKADIVATMLTHLAAAVSGVYLLHAGAHAGSESWDGDIDLIVTSPREAFLAALDDSAEAYGFSIVLEARRLLNTLEIEALLPGSTSWSVVMVDKQGTVLNFDVVFARGRAMDVEGMTFGSRFGVPELAEFGTTYLILKRIRKEDHSTAAWAVITARAGGAIPPLSTYIDAPLAAKIVGTLARGVAPSRELLRQAHWTLRRRTALSLSGARGLATGAGVALDRMLRPAGVFVGLGGVDGSGKSAAANELAEWSPFRRVRRLHSRPGVLKPPGWFLGRRPSSGAEPHGLESWGRAMSAFRLAYFWADFSIGHWARVWSVTARGGLVISERWWWDAYVDPRRHRLVPMPHAARVLGRLLPQPDVFLVLEAPSQCIRGRKQELTSAEIERQQAAWKRLAPVIPGLHVIDASRPIADVRQDAIHAVVGHQSGRIRSRRVGDEDYLRAVPRSRPRWVFDSRDAAAVSGALRLYQPSRPHARAVARGADTLVRRIPGMSRVLGRIGARPSPDAMRSIAWIRAGGASHVPSEAFRIAAFLGSEGPTRKVSAVALSPTGNPVFFAKVASSERAIAALANEARTLDGVAATVRSVQVPRVLSFERRGEGALLLLTPLIGSRFHNGAPATTLHDELISELLETRCAQDGGTHRDALAERLLHLPHSPAKSFFQAALASTHEMWPAVHSFHFSHGDLTPWNCLSCGPLLGVVDWEMAGFRLAGWDAVHYVAQIESIVRDEHPREASARMLAAPFLQRVGDAVARTCDADFPDPFRWHALKVLCLIDGAVDLLATQPELSRRGLAVRAHAIAHMLELPTPVLAS